MVLYASGLSKKQKSHDSRQCGKIPSCKTDNGIGRRSRRSRNISGEALEANPTTLSDNRPILNKVHEISSIYLIQLQTVYKALQLCWSEIFHTVEQKKFQNLSDDPNITPRMVLSFSVSSSRIWPQFLPFAHALPISQHHTHSISTGSLSQFFVNFSLFQSFWWIRLSTCYPKSISITPASFPTTLNKYGERL